MRIMRGEEGKTGRYNSMNKKVAMALTMQGGQSKQQAEFSTEQSSQISNRMEKGKEIELEIIFYLLLANFFFYR